MLIVKILHIWFQLKYIVRKYIFCYFRIKCFPMLFTVSKRHAVMITKQNAIGNFDNISNKRPINYATIYRVRVAYFFSKLYFKLRHRGIIKKDPTFVV